MQGPPGTGKSTTAAYLICHFLQRLRSYRKARVSASEPVKSLYGFTWIAPWGATQTCTLKILCFRCALRDQHGFSRERIRSANACHFSSACHAGTSRRTDAARLLPIQQGKRNQDIQPHESRSEHTALWGLRVLGFEGLRCRVQGLGDLEPETRYAVAGRKGLRSAVAVALAQEHRGHCPVTWRTSGCSATVCPIQSMRQLSEDCSGLCDIHRALILVAAECTASCQQHPAGSVGVLQLCKVSQGLPNRPGPVQICSAPELALIQRVLQG